MFSFLANVWKRKQSPCCESCDCCCYVSATGWMHVNVYTVSLQASNAGGALLVHQCIKFF